MNARDCWLRYTMTSQIWNMQHTIDWGIQRRTIQIVLRMSLLRYGSRMARDVGNLLLLYLSRSRVATGMRPTTERERRRTAYRLYIRTAQDRLPITKFSCIYHLHLYIFDIYNKHMCWRHSSRPSGVHPPDRHDATFPLLSPSSPSVSPLLTGLWGMIPGKFWN